MLQQHTTTKEAITSTTPTPWIAIGPVTEEVADEAEKLGISDTVYPDESAAIYFYGKLVAIADAYGTVDHLPGLDTFKHSENIKEQLESFATLMSELLPAHYPAAGNDPITPHWDVPCCMRCGYRKSNHNHNDACEEFVDTPEHLRF